MDRYNLELARDSLSEAARKLRHAEQYIIKAKYLFMADTITRIISAVENRNKELGELLRNEEGGVEA